MKIVDIILVTGFALFIYFTGVYAARNQYADEMLALQQKHLNVFNELEQCQKINWELRK